MKSKKWLILILSLLVVAVSACFFTACGNETSEEGSGKTTVTVKFDVNTDLQTNTTIDKEVTIGKRFSMPSVYITEDNPENLQVYGWYKEPECINRWDERKDRVSKDTTLYAKWVPLYEVNYYINGEPFKTENVFKGDYLTEDPTIVEGFRYEGTYVSAEYEKKNLYDFAMPVEKSLDLYIKRSEGLYLSDHVEEGMMASCNLTDYLTALCGSYNPETDSEGWVEPYVIESTGEHCTYVNLGVNMKYGDGYVEICRAFDISQSQIIKITMKNIGSANSMTCYFTTMLDQEGEYSATGGFYTGNFAWPNYIGGPGESMHIPSNMSEDDEWLEIELNLYEVYKYGYSVWGTSPFLGALRLEFHYKNESSEDLTNEILIKSIEGIPLDIPIENSAPVKEIATNDSAEEVKAVADAQTAQPNGFVFPKDNALAGAIKGEAEVFSTTDGLVFLAEDEISSRRNESLSKGFALTVPEGKDIDLAENTTLNVTLQNYGYGEEIMLYVYNSDGVPESVLIEIDSRMTEPKNYRINLYGKFAMYGTLDRIEFIYESVGIDNAIRFDAVYFSDFVPVDIVGINFNDKFHYGYTSTGDVEVSYDAGYTGIRFNVKNDGAQIASPDKTYDATNDGYEYAILHYVLPQNSNVTAVKVAYKINGQYTSDYVYELNTEEKGSQTASLKLKRGEGGFVKSVRLTFVGTGEVVIRKIEYATGETSLPFYKSYEAIYTGFLDWVKPNTYEYDSELQSSVFVKAPTADLIGAAIYIGYSVKIDYLNPQHTTTNVLITDKTQVKIVYQNKTAVDKMTVKIGFDEDPYKEADNNLTIPKFDAVDLPIDANMEEYEWSTLVIDIPADVYLNTYLAKINIAFAGQRIAIRAMSIEVAGA